MSKCAYVVPPGHGSQWLDAEVLERVLGDKEQHIPMDREPGAAVAHPRRAAEPLRYRPFERLALYSRGEALHRAE